RFCCVPTFGRDATRKFSKNVSSLSKLAVCDYEDILQCCIPVCEKLFPGKHNNIIQDLLFELTTYHSLAKLRLHTKRTIHFLNNSTTQLGRALQQFQNLTCSAFITVKLPKETMARRWRKA
ncbi:hypothetical protein SERLA73DRAFT_36592, partial [Serpula lacrymans var. lacrymans S7.3]